MLVEAIPAVRWRQPRQSLVVIVFLVSVSRPRTQQNARLRACWGLRPVSLCACTCSRVRGAALTAKGEGARGQTGEERDRAVNLWPCE